MNNGDLISIGIPAYNRADRISRTIDSILNQTYKNFELIISDDASTDETWQICEEYSRRDKRVRCFRQKNNLGLNGNFTFLLNQGKGEHFIWVGDDDYCHPDFILKLKEALDKNLNCGVAMSSFRRTLADDQLVDEIIYSNENTVTNFSSKRLFNSTLFYNPPIHFFTLGLWRRDVLDKLFIRPLPKTIGVDLILVCEASFITRFCSIPEILFEKTLYPVNKFERSAYKDYQQLYEENRVTIHFSVTLVKWLITSPNISIFTKIFILPSRLFMIFWSVKRRFLSEFLYFFKNVYKKHSL